MAGMDGLGLVGELSESFGFRGGSDALRRAPFVSRVGRGYLQFTFVSIPIIDLSKRHAYLKFSLSEESVGESSMG